MLTEEKKDKVEQAVKDAYRYGLADLDHLLRLREISEDFADMIVELGIAESLELTRNKTNEELENIIFGWKLHKKLSALKPVQEQKIHIFDFMKIIDKLSKEPMSEFMSLHDFLNSVTVREELELEIGAIENDKSNLE
jgi:hypothetical protein